MDSIEYYDKYAGAYYEDTVDLNLEEMLERFIELLPENASVLDLGCGSGRDSLYLIENGFEVTSVDGSKEMCELATIHTGQDVLNMRFDELDFCDVFDGVWACASLGHVDPSHINSVLDKIDTSLKEDGILYMSFKYGNFSGFRSGRFYMDYTSRSLKDMLKSHENFDIIDIWKSEDIRDTGDEQEWIQALIRKKKGEGWE